MKFRDYYEILGVPRTASADEVKRAYRKAARKHHPDVAPPEGRAQAEEEIKLVNEAYEVLRDPEKRKRYDALGANWKAGDDFRPPNGAAAPGGWATEEEFSDFFSSLFGDLGVRGFGGARRGRAGGGARGRMQARGGDVEAELRLPVTELLQGGKRRIALGGGRALDVDIPRTARDGTRLRLAGQGEPGFGGGPPGDLFLVIRVESDAHYRVVDDDLEMDLPLWPWQAVLGATVRVTIPGGAIDLKITPGTAAGQRLRIKGHGLPPDGDLFAVVRIDVPQAASDEERTAYEALRNASPAPKDRPAS